jgi:hypothetical protein
LKNCDQALTQHYVEKADHFLQAMKLLSDDMSAYASSVALLAVHSCISLNDAIAVAATGKRNKREDHKRAVKNLEHICAANNVADRKGLLHLTWLLACKTDVAYGERRLDSAFFANARDKAERFHAWAYNNFKGVLRG